MTKHNCIQTALLLIPILTMIFASLLARPAFGTSRSELLLRFKPGANEGSKGKILASLGLEIIDEIPQIKVLVVSIPENALLYVKSALSCNPVIDFVEENLLIPLESIPNDSYYSFQWHLSKIQAPNAWDTSVGNPNVIIAILDSGIDHNHPDLSARIIPGWNFYDNNDNTADVSGHGTAVAGVAAAITNNTIGVAAIAWQSSILPVRVTDTNGYTSYSLLAKGLVYAADRGAKTATVSFRIFNGTALTSAAKYFVDKGGLVVSAGGNTGKCEDYTDNPYIISVSGTTSDDKSWGSYGPYIDLSAPCSAIYTTINGWGYGNVGGTSFSAPLTAGLIGLIFSANPSLTPQQVEQILESTAVDLGASGYDIYYGWGRINASGALRVANGVTPPKDTTPPTVTITSPSNGSTVSDGITVSVDANDNVAVSKVELYKDGTLLATDVTSPWRFYWNTLSDSNGPHILVAKAYDTSSIVGESTPVTVNVCNTVDTTPPTTSINSPQDGAKVKGFVSVSVLATDSSGISKVDFYIDGLLKTSVYTAPYVYTWNSKSVKDGLHTITVRAYDSFNNWYPKSISVYVFNKK